MERLVLKLNGKFTRKELDESLWNHACDICKVEAFTTHKALISLGMDPDLMNNESFAKGTIMGVYLRLRADVEGRIGKGVCDDGS